MTAMAERLVKQLESLAPADLLEVWRRAGVPRNDAPAGPPLGTDAALEIVHSLYGRLAGANMTVRLLQERARDRAREEKKLRRCRPPRNG
jgi:hypothetical protein